MLPRNFQPSATIPLAQIPFVQMPLVSNPSLRNPLVGYSHRKFPPRTVINLMCNRLKHSTLPIHAHSQMTSITCMSDGKSEEIFCCTSQEGRQQWQPHFFYWPAGEISHWSKCSFKLISYTPRGEYLKRIVTAQDASYMALGRLYTSYESTKGYKLTWAYRHQSTK